jgi:hypothetical protein
MRYVATSQALSHGPQLADVLAVQALYDVVAEQLQLLAVTQAKTL